MNLFKIARKTAILLGLAAIASPALAQGPAISSITPSTGSTQGGTAVTLVGSNFGSNPAVLFGGNVATITSESNNIIIFASPAGEGVGRTIQVVSSGLVSNGVTFSYSPPSITSISPATTSTSGGATVTLSGSNFGINPVVILNGAAQTLTSNSHTLIRFTMPAGQGTNLPIVVVAGGQVSPTASISYSAPEITSVSPVNGTTAGGTRLTINGSNFGLSPVVRLGSVPLSLVLATHNQLQVDTPPGEGTALPLTVEVGGQVSNSFSYFYDPPLVTSISPATASTSGGTVITLIGSNFGLSPSVTFGGSSVSPLLTNSHNAITFAAPPGQGMGIPVVVTVAGQSSAPKLFSYAAPSLTSISPANGPTSGGTLITLTGSNFGLSPNVTIGGKSAPLAGPPNHTLLTVTLPSGVGANLPVVVSVLGRTSNSIAFSYNPPLISSVSPASGPVSGGTIITIQGSNFGPNSNVTIGGRPAPLSAPASDTTILCTLPAGSGQNKPVIVISAGQVSNTKFFSYDTQTFADWSASIPWNGLDSSPGADPRSTGWKNLLAYAFGVDPTTVHGGEIASRNPPVHGTPALSRDLSGKLQLSFWRRRTEVYPDLDYQVQFSDQLGVIGWEPPSLEPEVETVDDVWEFCTFTDHASAPGRRFGRVRLVIQQSQ